MKKTTSQELAQMFDIAPARSMEAQIKAKLISEVIKATKRNGLTHADLAERSGLPRSAVTGILSGSLQKVTIDRVLKLIEATNLVAEVRVKKAA